MPGTRKRGQDIREFILASVEQHPEDVARVVAEKFQITRQTANEHLRRLIADDVLTGQGDTSAREYKLKVTDAFERTYELPGAGEHEVLDGDIWPVIGYLPENVKSIWSTAFTEMYNNVLDHSAATAADVIIRKTAIWTDMVVHDNGIGVFKKIQQALNLPEERDAIIELSKGKFTTDHSKHSGEGIFFTSKMVDEFDILSDGLSFTGTANSLDWISEKFKSGTTVWMKLSNKSTRQPKDVYDKFTEDFAFNKTSIPIKLAQVGGQLVSRSQAKRILSRLAEFKTVQLDFSGVEWVGQAFADEIFRVYKKAHPEIQIEVVNTNEDVEKMIRRAQV
jgi:anti-sigma regulatory factor (Ser/Thr protein kinase)